MNLPLPSAGMVDPWPEILSLLTQKITYKGQPVGEATLAMVVGNGLVLDIKTLDILLPIHSSQLMAHLKAAGFRVGPVMNFKSPQLRDGIKRVVRSA